MATLMSISAFKRVLHKMSHLVMFMLRNDYLKIAML